MNASTYINWCNENEGRVYPVSELATRKSDAGLLLPDDIVVDIGILVSPELTDVRIAAITFTPSLVSVALVCGQGALAAGTYERSTIQPYRAYPLSPLVENVSGWIVFGGYSGTVAQYIFSTVAQSGLEPRTIRTAKPPGVIRFRRQNAHPDVSASGIVELQVDGGIVAELDPVNSRHIILRLDALHQPVYAAPCSSNLNRDCLVPIIRRINNIPADSEGNITLRFE